jgi:hypothetical protein
MQGRENRMNKGIEVWMGRMLENGMMSKARISWW